MNIKKLIGLYIDTNEYKFQPVKEGQEQEVYDALKNYCGLNNIRRVKEMGSGKWFTAYIYHYITGREKGKTLEEHLNQYLGETLEEYLNS